MPDTLEQSDAASSTDQTPVFCDGGVMQMMGQKRKRELDVDDALVKDTDSVVVKEALECFGGVWTAEHWRRALSNDMVTKEQLEKIIQALKLKNQTPQQVAMAILETFPMMVALQDCLGSRYPNPIPQIMKTRVPDHENQGTRP